MANAPYSNKTNVKGKVSRYTTLCIIGLMLMSSRLNAQVITKDQTFELDAVELVEGNEVTGNPELQLDHLSVVPEDPNATSGVKFVYENGTEMIHGGPSGCVFHGEKGSIHIDRGRLTSDPPELVKTPLAENEFHINKSPGHHRNWLDCIKTREKPIADVEKGARTVTIIHLGNQAYWNQKTLDWDPTQWKFKDAADNKYLDVERRAPWKLPELD